MKNTLEYVRAHRARAYAMALAASTALVVGFAGVAGATGDAVDTGFQTAQTSILQYLGDAVGLVVAVIGLSIGITMLMRWARRAAK